MTAKNKKETSNLKTGRSNEDNAKTDRSDTNHNATKQPEGKQNEANGKNITRNEAAQGETARNKEDEKFPLPIYESGDDIYSKGKELSLDDLENSGKERNTNSGNTLGSDLDIPGSELDDADEAIGEEDEENNYYSLGGDNHEDLEEDNPDQ